jgi:molybdate-binding protein
LTRPSLTSLDLLERGLVHVAGLHLLDVDSGEYNTPWVRRAFPRRAMRVVNLARWEQGLAIAPGNRRRIRTVADLAAPDLRIAQRPPASGARQLIDRHLDHAGIARAQLNVVAQAPDHASVARLVAMGLADVGPCIRGTALEWGLQFVPLAEERFDLVIPVEYDALPSIRALVGELDTRSFRDELDAVGGYDTSHTGEVVGVVR